MKIRPFTPGEELVSPTITLDTSNDEDSVIATIAVAITGAQIRYTLDGSTPDDNSDEYTGPIVVKESSTLSAITVRQDFQNSQPEVAEITVNPIQTQQAGHQISRLRTSLVGGALIFSNPYTDRDIQLTITDLSGNQLHETDLRTGQTATVSDLQSGCYIIRFTGPSQTTFQKVLVP